MATIYRFSCSDCDIVVDSATQGAADREMQGHRCYDDFDPKSLLTPERRAELFPSVDDLNNRPETKAARAKVVLGCRIIQGEGGNDAVMCTCGMSHEFTTRWIAQHVHDEHIKFCDGTPGLHEKRRAEAKAYDAALAQRREAS